ncbi:hypothetical protein SAMN04487944_11916 [Gracilibacillus ureilyticus]|uniref:Uncharacterized protein n=1 Tax=Gracilibacillus ureilyticus TaxID=531814 RepID=A0A1H9US48_9BACI|nr:hypothetical protein [Gracilibacillus ureilyticus]SES12216.1 hypothetical protein SAMN04487944_11916 [Gracilibacillus ureilyticus]
MDNVKLIRDAKLCTRWALGLTFFLIILFPGVMFLTGYSYSLAFFKGWTSLAIVWLVAAGLYTAIRPLVEFYMEKKAG